MSFIDYQTNISCLTDDEFSDLDLTFELPTAKDLFEVSTQELVAVNRSRHPTLVTLHYQKKNEERYPPKTIAANSWNVGVYIDWAKDRNMNMETISNRMTLHDDISNIFICNNSDKLC